MNPVASARVQNHYKPRATEENSCSTDNLYTVEVVNEYEREEQAADAGPTVYLIVGVNGVGKTTSIGKLAHQLRQEGQRVLLAAGDTWRAGAVEQLRLWAERIGADFVGGQQGGDPAAVAYDAIDAAVARDVDVVLVTNHDHAPEPTHARTARHV